jgi:methyl-accepting chemotaxis protein
VQEIAAASGEQSDGVAQITGAMGHLSSATQQTASASEELSATAEELSAQATQLQELMAFFKVDRSEPARTGLPQHAGRHADKARPQRAHAGAAATPAHLASRLIHRVAKPTGPGMKPVAGAVDESSFGSF